MYDTYDMYDDESPKYEFDIVDLGESTTGVPDPDRPGFWLVPPWRKGASFPAVVSHFLQRYPGDGASTQRFLAYYQRYQAAIETAPTDGMTYPGDRHWIDEIHRCIGKCVTAYREKRQAETQGGRGGVSSLRALRRGPSSAVREKAS